MEKQDWLFKQICTPQDYSKVSGLTVEVCRRHFRKWKREDDIPLNCMLTYEYVSLKSRIPITSFDLVRGKKVKESAIVA